jgi:hypothetical protein
VQCLYIVYAHIILTIKIPNLDHQYFNVKINNREVQIAKSKCNIQYPVHVKYLPCYKSTKKMQRKIEIRILQNNFKRLSFPLITQYDYAISINISLNPLWHRVQQLSNCNEFVLVICDKNAKRMSLQRDFLCIDLHSIITKHVSDANQMFRHFRHLYLMLSLYEYLMPKNYFFIRR